MLAISIVDDRGQSDSFKRYVRSLDVSGYKYEVNCNEQNFFSNFSLKNFLFYVKETIIFKIYGLDDDSDEISKAGFKVTTLVRELEKWKDDKEKVILFSKG